MKAVRTQTELKKPTEFASGNSFSFSFILFALVQSSFLASFFFYENLIKNLKLKIKLLILLRIHSYLFNKVRKSH